MSSGNGKEITVEPRLSIYDSPLAAKFAKHINSAGAVVTDRKSVV